jgi:hypothetical protein
MSPEEAAELVSEARNTNDPDDLSVALFKVLREITHCDSAEEAVELAQAAIDAD